MDFREKARQNALSDLAGNISVKISASSVLNQYEHDNNYSEYFRDNIRLSSEEYLEGYELVDSWDSEDQFWVYYRLSKEKYEQVKTQQKQAAIAKSLGNFGEATEFNALGNVKESIRFNIKALEDIKDFLGEDLMVEVDGIEQAYGSTLLSELTATIQNVRIVYPFETLDLIRGGTPENNPLIVKVLDSSGHALKGIGVTTTISWAPGKTIVSVSDVRGEARIEIDKAATKKTDEYIESVIDLDKLVRESTGDPVIRKLLQNISVPGYVLPVRIDAPVFFVDTHETNLGEQLNKPMIYPEIIQMLKRDGIIMTDDREEADFEIFLEAETLSGSQRSDMYFAILNTQITLINGSGQQLYNKSVDGISGMGGNFEDAGLDAYDALISKFKINIYPEMYKKLFK